MSDSVEIMDGIVETIAEPVPPPFGDDLRIDSEDEDNLERLPEIERELILSERHDTLQRYKESRALYEKYIKKMRASRPDRVEKVNDRKKSYDSASADSPSSSDSSSDTESSYSSGSRSENEDDAVRDLARVATEKGIADSLSLSLSPDVASSIQATRDLLLSSFQDVPVELRDEALTDLFVRVPSGNGAYVVSRVLRAVDRPSKSVDSGKFDIEVELPLNASTTVPVSSISNSAIISEELDAWVAQFGDEFASEQCKKVHRKQVQIKQVKAFVWDDRTINRILSHKNRSTVKLTLEIAKLRTQLQSELGALNSTSLSDEQRLSVQENINRINKEISQVESDYRAAQRAFSEANSHQFGIVAINHRNRTEQRLQDVEEARNRLKSSKGKTGELDPFKRRECKPVVMWDVGKRSPKKEPSADPTGLKPDQEMLSGLEPVEKRKTLVDLIGLEKLVDSIEQALAQPGTRLAAVRRKMARQYSETISPIWDNQLLATAQTGEIMDFPEWKRRVAEDVDMQE